MTTPQQITPEARAALDAAIAQAQRMGYEPNGKPTDDDLAEQWRSAHPDTVYGLGSMRRYSAGVWNALPDDTFENELLEVLQANKPRGIRPSRNLLASVKKLAQVAASVTDDRWDADPDVLVCANGTLHIPSMTLREHRREDYATSGVPYAYDPTATAPTLEFALRTTVPEAAGLIQEFAGYALTADTQHELALWFYGVRGSGKSTIIAGLQAMLGARCGLLGLADIERSNFALADLPGKSLVISTEQPATYMQASHKLNAVISGEPVRVERKYADAFQFRPTAKVLWAMNELPRVDAGDGLFRRVKVVRFQKLATAPDPTIKQRIAGEGAGILNWALAGLARLRRRGRFEIPACVEAATEQFEARNDIPAAFVAECCLTGPDYKAGGEALYAAYKAWCDRSGHRAQSSTAIAQEWERLGFERYRSAGKTIYRGVGLLESGAGVAGVAT